MTKANKYLPGILGILEKVFGIVGLAQVFGLTTEQVETIASHPARRPITPDEGMVTKHLCLLHGVRPILYRYNWKQHRGLFISSTATGWKSWTLTNGYGHKTEWLGSMDEIILASPSEIEEAKRKGWPTGLEDP